MRNSPDLYAIVSTGSFIEAAELLNVDQTTVSARVRTLEDQPGRPLFVRTNGGPALKSAGEQFLRYAPTYLQLWRALSGRYVAGSSITRAAR